MEEPVIEEPEPAQELAEKAEIYVHKGTDESAHVETAPSLAAVEKASALDSDTQSLGELRNSEIELKEPVEIAKRTDPIEEQHPEHHPHAIVQEHRRHLRDKRGAILQLRAQVQARIRHRQAEVVANFCEHTVLVFPISAANSNKLEPAAAWYFSLLSVVFRPAGRKTINKKKESTALPKAKGARYAKRIT